MKILKATIRNLADIGKLMKDEFSKPPFNEKDTMSAILKSLNFYFKIGKIYVAVINKEIGGVLVFKIEQYWEGPVIIIEDLAVKEKFKKQGIGKGLMKFIEKYSRNKKIKSILFSTHKKSRAIKFYEKLGYKLEKDRISMRKNLK